MLNPLFERADEDVEVPDHLAGMSTQEINDYWSKRVKQERQERAAAAAPPGTTPPARQPVTAPGMSAGQTQTLINGAKLIASQGKEYWARFLPETEGIMGQMSAEQQGDANMWNTVYEKVLGMHMSELTKEAREAALKPAITESSAAATPNEVTRVLNENEMKVVNGLARAGAVATRLDAAGKRISVPFDAEAYLAAEKRRQSNTLPLTFANY